MSQSSTDLWFLRFQISQEKNAQPENQILSKNVRKYIFNKNWQIGDRVTCNTAAWLQHGGGIKIGQSALRLFAAFQKF